MARDYDVGNILINIESKSRNINQTLDNTIEKLSSLKKVVNGISKVNIENVEKNLNSMSKLNFDNIVKAFKPLEDFDPKGISSFVRQMKNISNINFDNVDFQKMYLQFLAMQEIIDPFIQKIQNAEPALKAFSNALDLGRVNAQLIVAEAKVKAINERSQSRKVLDDKKIEKANYQLEITKKRLQIINEKSDKTKKSFNSIFNIGKIYFFINYFKRFATALVNVAKSAINFNETLNKFQVSMGSHYNQSIKFVNTLTRAFNLSTESVMNYQSTFKNMLSSLGSLGDETSYQLSETLTRMSLDYASLFNVEVDRAMEQFQAVLSGQIRSIRSVSGYDVSETSIFSIYQELGGTKTMRQLDQVEKRLLRIIAVQKQMEQTSALGDFAKTIDTTANQLKQLEETLKEVARWLGELAIKYLAPAVEKTLALSIAFKEMLKSLNIAKGYEYEDFGQKSIFGEMTESAETADEAVDSLKRNLLGFDKLNILSETQGENTTDYSLLTEKIKQYATSLDMVSNKATLISEKILTWLGYTKTLDEATGDYIWKLGEGVTNLDKIKGVLLGIGSAMATIAVMDTFSNISNQTGKIYESLSKIPGLLSPTTAIIAGIVALLAYMYTTNEDFKKSVDGLIESVVNVLTPILQIIVNLVEGVLGPVLGTLINEIAYILTPIINSITPVISLIGDIISSLAPIITLIGDLLGGTISVALNAIFGVLDLIIAPLELIVQLVSAGLQVGLGVVLSIIETIVAVFKTLGELIKSIFSGEDTPFLEKNFLELGEKVKEIWKGVGDTIKSTFIGIINSIITAFASFINGFTSKINDLTSTLSGIWEWTGLPSIPQIPTWTPEGIPMLASGGVINQPTVAMMGEYSGANSNPEIVTPENLMRQVFVESMLPIAQIIASGNGEIVSAIEEMASRPIEMNGRKVSEAIYGDLEKVAIRKGKTMFATTG